MNQLLKFTPILLCLCVLFGSMACAVEKKDATAKTADSTEPKKHKHTNRLIKEKSPYLLQHAHNPVDWHPWGKEAFALAKKLNKPIFLSVGYATCHWCHVMERESFENEAIAKIMNDNFVCIKVDREERPDVDNIYMTAVQAISGSGGWPMSVFMTPEGKPFYAGTYSPPTNKGGRAGFDTILKALAKTWKDKHDTVLTASDELTKNIARFSNSSKPGAINKEMLTNAIVGFDRSFDKEHGGFGTAPKFPTPHNLTFLLRHYQRTGDAKSLKMATTTLDGMMNGGLQDHLGGGFHRYSTDRVWLAPHFEKMLYDQALIGRAYVEAWQITGDPNYKRTADSIFKYVLDEMTHENGGFFSAEDADSEGKEGLFYLWTPKEVIAVLGEEKAKRFNAFYDVTEAGNFSEHGEPTGGSILRIQTSFGEAAKKNNMEIESFRAEMKESRAKLFKSRAKRIRPLLDDKILTAWNGLMIATLAHAGRVFDNDEYTKAAKNSAKFVMENLQQEGRLLRRWRNDEAALLGYIDDYSFFAWGLYELYVATGESQWLKESIRLSEESIRLFWDEENGGLFFSGKDGEKLITSTKEAYDGALPSGNSIAALNFLRIGHLTDNKKLSEKGVEILETFSSQLSRGMGTTQMLCALNFHYGPNQEIVLAGSPNSKDYQKMKSMICKKFLPNAVFVFREDNAEEIEKLIPFVKVQKTRDGRPTAYVCKNYACELPTTDVERLKQSLEKLK